MDEKCVLLPANYDAHFAGILMSPHFLAKWLMAFIFDLVPHSQYFICTINQFISGMGVKFSLLPEHEATLKISYGVAGIAAAIVVIARLLRGPNLDAIPTIGSSSWLYSWLDGFGSPTNAINVIQKGYDRYKSAPFKMADHYNWIVVVSNCDHIEEVSRAPDEVLSLIEGVNERFSTRYILGDEAHDKPFHIGVIRSQLTRSIGTLYPEIMDEIVTAFDEILDLKGDEWESVPALSVAQQVVCRTSNRLFVGLPLCRDPDWIDLNIRHTINIGMASIILGLFPKFLRSLVVFFLRSVSRSAARGLKLLGPIIEERLRHSDEFEMPNDLVSWLMKEAEPSQLTAKCLTDCVLMVNFTAIHMTSVSFTYALHFLVVCPQYIQPLREEVEGIVEKEGWSKVALNKMRKVDSFLKECQRIEGLNLAGLSRMALKDFRLSDGTFIPKGTLISIASRVVHYEEKLYKSADTFKPFRFAEMYGANGEDVNAQFVSTTTDYLVFGHGKHACPGRFLAASELKSMLAHVLVTYDIKSDGMTRPHGLQFSTSTMSDPQALKVLFRKRVK